MANFSQNLIATFAAILFCAGSFAAVVDVPTDTLNIASSAQSAQLA